MKENIQWLIEQYQHELEDIETDLKVDQYNVYIKGRRQVFEMVIKDLQGLLEGQE